MTKNKKSDIIKSNKKEKLKKEDVMNKRIDLKLHDTQWGYEYTNYYRRIARAIVYDKDKIS